MLKHKTADPPTLKEATLGEEFSDDIERVLSRLLKKNPNDRYQDIADVGDHLKRIMGNSPVFVNGAALPRKRASFKPGMPAIIIASVGLIACISLVAFEGMTFLARKLQEAKEQLTTKGDENQNAYFSKRDDSEPSVRVFQFPEKAIGLLDADEGAFFFRRRDDTPNSVRLEGRHTKAQGRIEVHGFQSGCLRFRTNEAVSENPKLLEKFRDDELVSLTITHDYNMANVDTAASANPKESTQNNPVILASEDEILKHALCLKSLKHLDVDQTKATDACLETIAHINLLEDLNVAGTDIEGRELAKLPQLLHLCYLNVENMENITPTILALKESTQLNYLNASWDDLSENDLETIATMENLNHLTLRGSKVTWNGLVHLKNLKHLNWLNIEECQLGHDYTAISKLLPNVKHIELARRNRSNESVNDMKDSLPKIPLFK
jgi:hypothetical protein